nr:putative Acetylornithine deacetylase [Candidatus Pantoea persica]
MGIALGGDVGPVLSAAGKVVDDYTWPLVDLRIEWADSERARSIRATRRATACPAMNSALRTLVAHLWASPEKPALCIIGEPTEMKPVYGHKGKAAMRCEVRGRACHSAYAPSGVNAIEQAAKLIGHIVEIGETLRQTRDARFDPPFSTLQVGTALNIVPQDCQFDLELRTLPGADAAAVLEDIQAFARRFNQEVIAAGDRAAFEVLVAPGFINHSAPLGAPRDRESL